MLRIFSGLKLVMACLCMALLVACSKDEKPQLAVNQPPPPGSQRDFIGNVGDRVHFIVDQSTLTPQAQEILRRQAAWLRQILVSQIARAYRHHRFEKRDMDRERSLESRLELLIADTVPRRSARTVLCDGADGLAERAAADVARMPDRIAAAIRGVRFLMGFPRWLFLRFVPGVLISRRRRFGWLSLWITPVAGRGRILVHPIRWF